MFGGDIDKERHAYKDRIGGIMADRNKYRELISVRKEKDKQVQDIIAMDKIDLG